MKRFARRVLLVLALVPALIAGAAIGAVEGVRGAWDGMKFLWDEA